MVAYSSGSPSLPQKRYCSKHPPQREPGLSFLFRAFLHKDPKKIQKEVIPSSWPRGFWCLPKSQAFTAKRSLSPKRRSLWPEWRQGAFLAKNPPRNIQLESQSGFSGSSLSNPANISDKTVSHNLKSTKCSKIYHPQVSAMFLGCTTMIQGQTNRQTYRPPKHRTSQQFSKGLGRKQKRNRNRRWKESTSSELCQLSISFLFTKTSPSHWSDSPQPVATPPIRTEPKPLLFHWRDLWSWS